MIDATAFQVGLLPQLFVDNWLIEQSDSVTRRWHKPQRLGDGPVLTADRPWEDTPYFTYSNFNVLKDPTDGLIKCWYEDLGPMSPYQRHPWKNRMLYAVSRDGVHFDKPLMDLVPVDGQKTNIFAGYVEGATPSAQNPWADTGVHSAGVVIDPAPVDPAQRYRMLFTRATSDYGHEIDCAHSPDGLTWQSYGQAPTFGTTGAKLSDVSTITFDPVTRLYTQYTRHGGMNTVGAPGHWPEVPSGWGGCFQSYFPHRPDLMNKRRVYRSVSADFLNWSDLVPVSTPDESLDNLDDAHYGMGQFRVGGLHFGTLGVLHYVDNEMDVRLLFSRDGIAYQPADNGKPFLSPRAGQWDRHMVSIVSPPVRMGDDWYFYHGGSWAHHDYWWAGPQHLGHEEAREPASHVRFGMGVARLRYEGIASVDNSGPRIGRVVTRPLSTTGNRLAINARCRNGGSIRVAVSDTSGNILPGRGFEDCVPFSGDAIRHAVRWKDGAVFNPHGKEGEFNKIWFELVDAELFAFAFEDGASHG